MTSKYFIGGNWKLNGSRKLLGQFCAAFSQPSSQLCLSSCQDRIDIVLAPPIVYLSPLLQSLEEANASKAVQVGSQDISEYAQGPYTGEVSASMVKDIGGEWTILGHSERRAHFRDSSQSLETKLRLGLKEGLGLIYCVGESLEIRETGIPAIHVHLEHQLATLLALGSDVNKAGMRLIVAYEPVWAIGTGKVATPEQAEEVHEFIDNWLKTHLTTSTSTIRIIYGGSVTAANCLGLISQPHVSGFLIGGSSLNPTELLSIIATCQSHHHHYHCDSQR